MIVLQNTVRRPIGGLSFAPDGRLVAGGSGGFDIWNLATRSATHHKSHAEKYLFGLAADPLGRWVYVSDSLGGFRFLPLDAESLPMMPGSRYSRHVRSFDVSADGSRVVVSRGGAGANRIEFWDAGTGLDGVWSLADGRPVPFDEPYYLNSTGWNISSVAVNGNGSRIADFESGAARVAGRVGLRDGSDGNKLGDLGFTDASFQGELAFAPGGTSLFVWDQQLLERWDLAAGVRSHVRKSPGRAYFTGFAVHPGGRFVLTAGGDGLVRFWDADTLEPGRVMKWGIGKLHAVAVSPDGLLAAAGGEKGQVVVWDLDD